MRLLLLCLILSVEKDGERLREGTPAGDGARHLCLLLLQQPSSTSNPQPVLDEGLGSLFLGCHHDTLSLPLHAAQTFPLLFSESTLKPWISLCLNPPPASGANPGSWLSVTEGILPWRPP